MDPLIMVLAVVCLVLAVTSLGVGMLIPFLLWKQLKLEQKLDALDDTLAAALQGDAKK